MNVSGCGVVASTRGRSRRSRRRSVHARRGPRPRGRKSGARTSPLFAPTQFLTRPFVGCREALTVPNGTSSARSSPQTDPGGAKAPHVDDNLDVGLDDGGDDPRQRPRHGSLLMVVAGQRDSARPHVIAARFRSCSWSPAQPFRWPHEPSRLRPAGDVQDLSGDEARAVAREEGNRVSDVGGRADAGDRNLPGDRGLEVLE